MLLVVTPKTQRLAVTDIVTDKLFFRMPASRRLSAFLFTGIFLAISGCERSVPEAVQGDKALVNQETERQRLAARFDQPLASLPESEIASFYAGRALAHQPWVKAPSSTTARDGLGPLFNARSCLGCHDKGGRGKMPADETSPVFTALLRFSIEGAGEGEGLRVEPLTVESNQQAANQGVLQQQGALPEPVYGLQLQPQSTALSSQLGIPAKEGEVLAEGDLRIRWIFRDVVYPDGKKVQLRTPEILLNTLNYGSLHSDTRMSLRQAPGMFGMGLIDAIPQVDIDALADPYDDNKDGISGRVNQVWSPLLKQTVPGRYGWKANRPDLMTISAAAFADDIGISNPVFPAQPCTPAQIACLQEKTGNNQEGFELPQDLLELTVNFLRYTGAPEQRELSQKGKALFNSAGCQSCHHPEYLVDSNRVTGNQAPGNRVPGKNGTGTLRVGVLKVSPYSDFLLHDMGTALADNRRDFIASGSEWRTAPLWGIGLQKQISGELSLLHDGRARSVEEAVLWHGGEALMARERFTRMTVHERQQLIQFVEAL